MLNSVTGCYSANQLCILSDLNQIHTDERRQRKLTVKIWPLSSEWMDSDNQYVSYPTLWLLKSTTWSTTLNFFFLSTAVLSVSYWIYNSLYWLKLKRHFCHNLTSPVFPHVLVLSLYLAVEYSQLACSIFPLRMPISLDTMSSRAWSSFWILFNFTASAWVCLDLWKVTNCLINLILLPQFWSSGHNNMLLNTEPRQPYLLLRNSFCQQSFLAPIPLFDYLLLLLQLLQTRLLPSVIRHGEDPRFTVSVTSHCFSLSFVFISTPKPVITLCVSSGTPFTTMWLNYGPLSSKSYFCDLIDVYSLHKTF